ncbi:nitroreductase/quinone reductase family protein [Nocardioides panaciterrulae]|uniref:DUF385 domain-containing protein n=1 Tax=Nocardioides panaciterrulae TaxID=661492 RepID=A0A7Y9E853_9ACTN|nr:hypothetical protein [Nocardioides panaciterrulae]
MTVSTRDSVVAARTEVPTRAPSVVRWTALCAAAEALGMTAAAGASRVGHTLADRTGLLGGAGAALAVVVVGGLVEGVALGSAQAWPLGRWLPAFRRGRYVLATVLVAGIGWAGASAPAVLTGEGGGTGPPFSLVLPGAAGLGLLMGALLGSVQAIALRGATSHPWRWVAANALAWPPAMVVIFVGAGLPSADTPLALLLLDGAVTGAVAGAVLGVVTGWHLASLTGPPAHNRVVLDLLASPWRGRLDRRVLGLEVRGRATGRRYRLPVQYAVDDDGLVVVPGRPERKTWWTNLTAPATPVAVLWGGDWVPGAAEVLRPGRPGYEHARTTYARRWRRTRLPAAQPVVRIRYAGPRIESRAGNP